MLEALNSAASDLRHLAAALSGVPTPQDEGWKGGDQNAASAEGSSTYFTHAAPQYGSLGLREQYVPPTARRAFAPQPVGGGVKGGTHTPRPRRAAPVTPQQQRAGLVADILSPQGGAAGRFVGESGTAAPRGGGDWRRAPPPRVTSVADIAMGRKQRR